MQTKYWVYILSFLRLDSNKIYLSKGTLAYKGVDFVAIEPLFARINNVIVICVIVSIVVHVDLALLVTALVSLTLGHFPLLLCIVHLKQGQILSYSTTKPYNIIYKVMSLSTPFAPYQMYTKRGKLSLMMLNW